MEPVDDSQLMMVSHLDPDLKNDLGPLASPHSPHKPVHSDTGNTDIRNIFELQEFMAERNAEGKTTLAALKMISSPSLESSSPAIKDSPATILVPYHPHEKQKRLGRPRRHLEGRSVPDPDTLSFENLEKLTLSKFRLDERPVEGPGSRGGDPAQVKRKKGQVTESSTMKKRKQALLDFSRAGESGHLGLLSKEGPDARESGMSIIDDDDQSLDSELSMTSASVAAPQNSELVDASSTEAVETKAGLRTDLLETEPLRTESLQTDLLQTESSDNEPLKTEPDAKSEHISSSDPKRIAKESPQSVAAANLTLNTTTESHPPGRARTAARKKVMDEAKAKKNEEQKLEEEQQKRPSRKVKSKKNGQEKAVKVKKLTLNFKQPPSVTTIVRQKNRITRTYPGPLVPVHFDLYDENIMTAEPNKATQSENLALGFPVKPSPYLADIIYVILYLTKFRHIVDVGPIGPEDIERGLGLYDEEEFIKVSPLMEQLFRKVLALVLNRKKPILLSMQRSAVQELRSQYLNLGLPEEWRDDTMARGVSLLPCDPDLDQVDPSKPKVELSDNYEYLTPLEKLNPFLTPEFYEYGLQGIPEPKDRLVVIRSLMVWSLSVSNILKAHMVNVVNNQDIAGEKDTCYGSRSVLKGFTQTAELKREVELKMLKKSKSQGKSSTPDPDSANRYIDPTSDPTIHPMSLRLNDFLVGDCGFRIGRFYLVRMADSSAGGLGSLEKMKSVVNDVAGVRSSIPSTFKLYVEDVYSVLQEYLRVGGVEFDAEGNEVQTSTLYDDSKHWFVVASRTEELSAFLNLLEERLGLASKEGNIISLGSLSHKPLLHMYKYLSHLLPLLEEYERLNINSAGELRTSRKKKVDYAARAEIEEEDDIPEFVQDQGDDDDYDDGGGQEDYLDGDFV